MRKTVNNDAIGVYEPSLSMVVLRACPACGCKHPLAFDPPLPTEHCPKCGADLPPPPPPQTVPSTIISRFTAWMKGL